MRKRVMARLIEALFGTVRRAWRERREAKVCANRAQRRRMKRQRTRELRRWMGRAAVRLGRIEFEQLEPRVVLNGDLNPVGAALATPVSVLPAQHFILPVELKNAGPDALAGPVVNVYGSTDGLLDPADVLLGHATIANPLNANETKIAQVDIDPNALNGPGIYSLIAVVDPAGAIAESNENNNTLVLSDALIVKGNFQAGQALSVTDTDGTQVTFTMSGAGGGEVAPSAQGFDVAVTGASTSSAITVTTVGGDTRANLHNLNVAGSLQSFSGAKLDLTGDVQVSGTLATLTLGNIGAPHQINVSGTGVAFAFTAAQVVDLGLNVASPITSINVQSWQDLDAIRDVIRAPSIGTLTSAGSFNASLELTGVGVPGFVLTNANIGGAINGGLWNITGRANQVTAQSIAQSWQGSFTQALQTLTTTGNLSGVIATPSIQIITVGGDLKNAQIYAGANLGSDGLFGGTGSAADTFGKGVLARLRVTGSVIDSVIRVGIDPKDGSFDNGNDQSVPGSNVQELIVGGSLQGNTSIVSPAYPATVRVGGVNYAPQSLPQTKSAPLDNQAPTLNLALVNDSGTSAIDGYTNDTTIKGQITEAGTVASLRVGVDDADPANWVNLTATVQADKTFTLTRALLEQANHGTLLDGGHTVYAQVTDGGGNASAVVTLADTLDTRKPNAPTVTLDPASDSGTFNNDGVTNDNTPTVNLAAEAGSTLDVFVDGQQLLGILPFEPGPLPLTLAEGRHEVTAFARDLAGNVGDLSTPLALTIDTVTPATPAFDLALASDTAPLGDQQTSEATVTLTGTTEALAKVTLLPLGFETTADATEAFSFTGIALAVGANPFITRATDTAGNFSEFSRTITRVSGTTDTEPPVIAAALANDTGSNAHDGITKDATVSGTVTDASAIALFRAGLDNTPVDSFFDVFAKLQLDRSFTLNRADLDTVAGGVLADGPHTLHLRATDAFGNTGVSDLAFNLDTSRPAAPTVTLDPASDSGVLNSDGITHDSTPTLTLTGEAGSTLKLFKGGIETGDSVTGPSGQVTIASLADNTYQFTATATDLAGNTSDASTAATVTIDTTAPAAPAFDLAPASDSAPTGDHQTTASVVTLNGTTAALAKVTLLDAGLNPLAEATADAGGAFSFTNIAIALGANAFTTRATDTAGNLGEFSRTITRISSTGDTESPLVAAALANDTGSNAHDGITKDATVSGTVTDASAITLFTAGLDNTPVASFVDVFAKLQPDHSFTLSRFDVDAVAGGVLADGPHTLHLRATDAFGNTGVLDLAFNLDTSRPAAPTVALDPASDSGAFNNDRITSDNTPTFNLSGEAGATLTLLKGGIATGDTVTGPNGQVTVAALADNTYQFTATATDLAGNTSDASTTATVTIDTTAPAAPAFDLALASDSAPTGDHQTTASVVTLNGTTAALAKVTLLDAGLNPLAEATADAGGAFSFTNIALALGANAFTSRATDTAGNVADFSRAITRVSGTGDTEPPAIAAALANDTGNDAHDGITKDAGVSGTVSDASAIASFRAGLDATPIGSYADISGDLHPDGAFSLTQAHLAAIAGSTLADGVHTLHFIATDTSGNAGSFDLAFTLDTIAPVSPVFDLAATSDTGITGDHETSATVVSLVGTTEAGVTVTLTPGEAQALAGAGGLFQFGNVSLNSGANPFTAVATDIAGNQASTTVTITRAGQLITDAVTQWNQMTLDAIKLDASAPTMASRTLAMVSLAVFDTVNAIEGTPAYLVAKAAAPGTSVDAAVASAAHQVLSYLYPGQQAVFDSAYSAAIAAIPDGAAKTAGIALGTSVADAVIAIRANDGWKDFVEDDGSTAVGAWRPTAPMYAVALDPQWADLTPFALARPDQFQSGPPPALGSAEYAAGVNETESLGSLTSATRTAEQTQIARFWVDGSGTVTPSGHWNEIAQKVATQEGLSLGDKARLFAQLNVALADAGITAWSTKYAYDLWRPIDAIHAADQDGNAATTADSTWQPFILTPPFPEYTSGHSTYSAAAATVLTDFFGEDYDFSASSPGVVGLTRSFTSFDQAAEEAGRSRIYGGIHYEFSNQAGQAAGRAVGEYVLERFKLAEDTQAPKVVFDRPPGLVTRTNQTLTGQVFDNLSGVASLSVAIDQGAPAPVLFGQDGKLSFTTSFATDGTQDGKHVLAFVATDHQGNTAQPTTFTLTLDTRAPAISLTSLTDGSNIDVASRLTGMADPTGSTLIKLTYAFDGGKAVPVSFDPATGAFDDALDLSKLGTGSHTLAVSALDAAGDSATSTLHVTLPELIPLTITQTTPSEGAGDVGSTFRPQVFFSRAVDATTLNSNNFYATDTTNSKLDATIVPARDGSFAWLFLKNPMPGASTITIHVVGNTILAQAGGQALDADGDGTPGGTFEYHFNTVSLAPIPNTTITGRLLDPGDDLKPMTFDDIRAGADGALHTADDIFLHPIAHAKIFIIGLEGNVVFTDANGFFQLTEVPAGDVKLVIDGNTATNAPAGAYYPEMVMDLTIEPGLDNTVMGSMGTSQQMAANEERQEVYLPRLQTAILQTVSNTQTTEIGVNAVSAPNLTDQQRAQLKLEVAPGSLLGADGNVVTGGKVGISTVPPELVRDMLPPGVLQHTFDITIQAKDANGTAVAAFAEPLQITFPNVFNAAPGTTLNFLSFDHTTGRLVIEGTATVSADGLSVTSDPGQGITKPGWHGLTQAIAKVVATVKDLGFATEKLAEATFDVVRKALGTVVSGIAELIRIVDTAAGFVDAIPFAGPAWDAATSIAGYLVGEAADFIAGTDSPTSNEQWELLKAQLATNLAGFASSEAGGSIVFDAYSTVFELRGDYLNSIDITLKAGATVDSFNEFSAAWNQFTSKLEAAGTAISDATKLAMQLAIDKAKTSLSNLWDDIRNTKLFTEGFRRLLELSRMASDVSPQALAVETQASIAASGISLEPFKEEVRQLLIGFSSQIPNIGKYGNNLISSTQSRYLGQAQQAIGDIQDILASFAQPMRGVLYSIDIPGATLRGQVDGIGAVDVAVPRNRPFVLNFFDPVTGASWANAYNSLSSNNIRLTSLRTTSTVGVDLDGDGLDQLAEQIAGTSPTAIDTDGDGVSDFAEILAGTDPLGGRSLPTGVVGSVALQGEAKGIAIAGSTTSGDTQTAYVATGSYGLAIVDASQFRKPVVLAQLDLAGDSLDVSVDSSLGIAAVASGTGGLNLVDVSNPSTPKLLQTIALNATQVEVFEGIAYVSTGAELRAYDMLTGEKRDTFSAGASITGLAREGRTLYTVDASRTLRALDTSGGSLVGRGSLALPVAGNKLFVGGGIAYVGTANAITQGFMTVNVSDPANLTLISGVDAANIIGEALAANGSGLLIAAGTITTATGPVNAVDVINVTNPANTGNLVTRFNLSQGPFDVAIGAGVAFVADGTGDLQVVNYLSLDNRGVSPTVNATFDALDLDPLTPGIQVLEGSQLNIRPTTTDDVQVRNVELLQNGVVVRNDVAFPFDFSIALPTLATSASNQVSFQVRATDTGGNFGLSTPITVTLVPDTFGPTLLAQSLTEGALVGTSFRAVTLTFSEALDQAAFGAETVQLIDGNGVAIAPQNVQFRQDSKQVQVTFAQQALGNYTLRIDATQVKDRAGNALGATPLDIHFTIKQFSVEWIAPAGGNWNTAANWSTGVVPTATDDVFIGATTSPVVISAGAVTIQTLTSDAPLTLSGGTLSVAGASRINGAFVQSGGTLSGTGNVTINGPANITNGDMRGTGTTILNGATSISSLGLTLDGGRVLTNNGTLTWTAGTIEMNFNTLAGAGTINSAAGATWNDSGAGKLMRSAFGTAADNALAVFNNAGTYNRSGPGTSSIGVNFTNTGTLNVASGTLDFFASTNTHSAGSTITVGAGATLINSGSTQVLNGGTVNVAGTLSMNGSFSELNIAAAQAINGTGTLALANGVLTGATTLTVNTSAAITFVRMRDAGTTLLNGTTTVSGSGFVLDGGRVLTNNSTLTWTGGTIELNDSAQAGAGTINNPAGSTWIDSGAATKTMRSAFGTAADNALASFNNAGTYTKSGTGPSFIGANFTNTGALNVTGGTLEFFAFANTHSAASTISVGTGATLNNSGSTQVLTGGTVNVAGALSMNGSFAELNIAAAQAINGTGTLALANGLLTGATTLTVNTSAAITFVRMRDAGTTLLNGTTTVSGSGFVLDGGRVLTNNSTLTWTGGTIELNDSAQAGAGTLNNPVGSTWIDSGAATKTMRSAFGTAADNALASFNNAGTYTKSGTGPSFIGANFTNTGALNVTGGTLDFFGFTNTHSAGSTISVGAGATLNNSGSKQVFNGGTVNVTGTLSMDGSFAELNIAAAQVINGTGSLALANGILTGATTLTVNTSAAITFVRMRDAGTTLLNGATTVSGSGFVLDGGRVLTNNSTLTWTGGTIELNDNDQLGAGTINNPVGSTWIDTGTAAKTMRSAFGSAADNALASFNNAGTYTKSGTGTTSIGANFNNTGTLNVTGGTVDFFGFTNTHSAASTINVGTGATLNNSGSKQVLNGGTVNVVGTFSMNGSVSELNIAAVQAINGTGSLGLANGVLTGATTLTVNTNAAITFVRMRDAGTTLLNGATTVSGSGFVLDGGRVLTNNGTLTWTGGTIELNDSAQAGAGTLNNAVGATWNDSGTANKLMRSAFGSAADNALASFNNAGTFTKSGTGQTQISNAFANSGTVNANAGTLLASLGLQSSGTIRIGAGVTVAVTGNYTQSPTGALTMEIGGLATSQFGRMTITGVADLNGTLNVVLVNGFTPALNNRFQFMTFGSRTGFFSATTGLAIGGGLAFSVDQSDPKDLELVVV